MSEPTAEKLISLLRERVSQDTLDTAELDSDYFSCGVDGYDCGVIDTMFVVEALLEEWFAE